MRILALPAALGNSWRVASTDVNTGESVAFNAEIPEKVRINACGVPLDAIRVHIDGQLATQCAPTDPPGCTTVNPGGLTGNARTQTTVSFVADYDFATQFGGIAIADSVRTEGTSNGIGVTKKLTSIINREPLAVTLR
jgi:hypothetical protein